MPCVRVLQNLSLYFVFLMLSERRALLSQALFLSLFLPGHSLDVGVYSIRHLDPITRHLIGVRMMVTLIHEWVFVDNGVVQTAKKKS